MLLASIFELIFLSINFTPANAQAQPDNFPIGMYIVYTVDSQIPPVKENIYTIGYDFRQWIDQESLLVEYEKENVTYIDPLFGICLDGPEHPPIWIDVSLFQSPSVFVFAGINYTYTIIEEIWCGSLGDQECFRLEYLRQERGMENWSIVYYHCETGMLLDYTHAAYDLNEDTLIEGYSEFIFGTNLDEFNPPTITMPEPTTTTPTTTSTSTATTSSSTQTTSSSTTSATTSAIASPVGLSEMLALGIIVEIIIIFVLLEKKRK